MVLKPSYILSRRFVRLKAMQHLYAFHVGKQANYHCVLEQIRQELAFDIFADPPVDKQQQAIYQKQALSLFASWANTHLLEESALLSYPASVQKSVKGAQITYSTELSKDLHKLQSGWHTTVERLQENCLWVLQLLIEWTQVAQQQAGRIKVSKQHTPEQGIRLLNNLLLDTLGTDPDFKQLIKKHSINWSNYRDLVWGWYRDYIKNNAQWEAETTGAINLAQEKAILFYLVEKVIFEEKLIQDFFDELDLSWIAHKSVVRKLSCQVLENLYENKEKNTSLGFWGITHEWEGAADFYNQLITHTLEQDQAFEETIRQHTKNWSIERIVLLDKVIIKLALAEMTYLVSIPIKVTINEYIELSKSYSTPKSRTFINGVLDAVAKKL
jgi:N utilization substance protein B